MPFDAHYEEEGKRMNWKRTARWSWLVLPFLLLALWPAVAAAHDDKHKRGARPCTEMESGQACLYEVTEETVFDDPAAPTVRNAMASLMGRVVGVFPGCEAGCDIVAVASSFISVGTGGGIPLSVAAGLGFPFADCPASAGLASVCGRFAVVINEPGSVDASEVIVALGELSGEGDLSPAVGAGIPLGSIKNGVWAAQGVNPLTGEPFALGGTFQGTFRLPFTNPGHVRDFWRHKFHLPARGIQPAFYLLDNGKRTPVGLNERSLGAPTVRLEVEFVAVGP